MKRRDGPIGLSFRYLTLDRATSLLDATEAELVHAAAIGEVRMCVNVYGRASGIEMTRIDPAEEEIEAADKTGPFGAMPDGIYELWEDDLRFLEILDDGECELLEAVKRDERGWWSVTFDPPIPIRRRDLVMLPDEIQRLSQRKRQAAEPSSGEHVSPKLATLNRAAARFWKNADRNDRSTHPDKVVVVDWLEKEGFSATLADAAATIIRPEWAPAGRKPDN